MNKAIELNPDFAGAYALRGATLQVQGKYSAAAEDFTKCIELSASDAQVKATCERQLAELPTE